MICIKCKSNIPEDSAFCPNCGSSIVKKTNAESTFKDNNMINKTRSTKIKFCKNCGKERILSNYKCTSCGKISGMYILKIFAIVLLLILLGISVFFNIYQYNISIEKTIYYEKKIKQNEHQINALFDRENSEAAETKELLSEIYEGTVKIYKNPNGELQLQWPNNSQVRIYK